MLVFRELTLATRWREAYQVPSSAVNWIAGLTARTTVTTNTPRHRRHGRSSTHSCHFMEYSPCLSVEGIPNLSADGIGRDQARERISIMVAPV